MKLRILSTARLSFPLASALAALFNLAAPSNLQAAIMFWDGAGGNVNWSTVNNWGTSGANITSNPLAIPGSADDVVFYSTGATQLTTNIINQAFTLQSLTFGNSQTGAVTLGGTGVLTLNGLLNYDSATFSSGVVAGLTTPSTLRTGIYVQSGFGATTISAPITLGNAQQWVNNSANTLLIQTGALTNGANTLTVGGTGNTTISSIFTGSGAGGVTKVGAGTLTLSGANTYSGTTTVTAGTLRATTSASALGAGALSLGGGTLQLAHTAALTFARNTTITATSTITADRTTSSATSLTHTLGTLSIGAQTLNITRGSLITGAGVGGITFGATTLTGASIFDTAVSTNLTLGAVGGNFALTKQGAGTLTLSAASTSTAVTNINVGSVVIQNATSLGTPATNTIVASGGQLFMGTASLSIAEALNLTGTGNATNGALQFGNGVSGMAVTGAITLGGNASIQGDGGTGVTLSGGIDLGSNTLTYNADGGATHTISTAAIIGVGGSLTKTGSGTLTLSAANTFTGATTISAGTLAITSTGSLGNTAIGVTGAGTTFSVTPGSGTVNLGNSSTAALGASLNLASSTVFSMVDGAIGTTNLVQGSTFATAGLTLAGATLNFDVAGVGSADNLAVTGAAATATVSGTNLINITPVTGFGAGANTLISKVAAGGSLAGTYNFAATGATTQTVAFGTNAYVMTLSNATSAVTVTTGAAAAITGLVWTGRANGLTTASTTWDTNSNNNNWANGATAINYANANAVTFQDTNPVGGTAPSGTVTIQGAGVSPASTVFNNSTVNYTVSNASGVIGIAGTGSLTKSGTASVTLSSANTYSGGTTINAGTLTVANNTALGTGTVTLNAGILAINGGLTVANAINSPVSTTATILSTSSTNVSFYTMSGAVTGAGTLNFTFTPGSSGVIANVLPNFATFTGTIGVSTASAFNFPQFTIANGAPSATVNVTGGSSGSTSGSFLYSNAAGTMNIGALTGNGYIGSFASGTTIWSVGALNSDTTFSGVMQNNPFGGTGFALTKVGAGTLTLTGVNTYTGATTISAGILNANTTSALGNGSATNILTFTGGTLQAGGTITSPSTRTVTLTGTGLIDTNNNAVSIAGIMSGAGGVTKSGLGTLTLTGANTYNGNTRINGGTLNVNATGALGSASNSLQFGGGTLQAGGTITSPSTRTVSLFNTGRIDTNNNAVSIAGIISDTGGLLKIGLGTLTLTGANTYSGVTTIEAGSLVAGSSSLVSTNGAFGNTNSGLVLGSASTLLGDAPAVLINTGALTVGRDITVGTGAATAYNATIGGSNTTGTSTFTGNITLTNIGSYTTTLQAATGGTVAFTTGTWTNAGNMGINFGSTGNTGTVLLSNTLPNTSGAMAVRFGTLQLGGAAVLGGSSVTASVDSGAVLDVNSQAVANTYALTLNGTGISSGGALISSTGSGSYAGAVTLGSNSSIGGAGNLSIGGQIGESVALTTLTKVGAGTLTLSNANNYTGATSISASGGTLRLAHASAVSGTPSITMVSGTTLQVGTDTAFVGPRIVSTAGTIVSDRATTGAGPLGVGLTHAFSGVSRLGSGNTNIIAGTNVTNGTPAIQFASLDNDNGTVAGFGLNPTTADVIVVGGVNMGGGANAGTANFTLTGTSLGSSIGGAIINGARVTANVIKSGTGTWTLAGLNTYNGTTVISDGTLSLTGSLTGGGAISTNTTGILSQSAAGVISGASTVSVGGSATSVLAGDNTYSGLTQVSGTATLTLSGDNSGAGGVTLSTGGTGSNTPRLNVNSATALGTGTLNFGGGLATDTVRLDNTSAGTVNVSTTNAFTINRNFTFIGTQSLNLGNGTATLSGLSTGASRSISVTASTLTLDGVVTETTPGTSNFGITLGGNGTLALTNAANTYTGKTVIGNNVGSSLRLQVSKLADLGVASSLGAPATAALGLIQIGSASNSSTLELVGGTSASTTNRQVQIGSSANGSGNAIIQNNNTDAAHTLTFSNAAFNVASTGVTSSSRSLQLAGTNTGDNTISGTIIPNTGGSGTTGLVKSGTGTWVLNGTSSFTGAVSVQNGILKVNSIKDSGTNSAAGAGVTIALGTTTTGTLVYTGSGDSTNRPIRVGSATVGETGGGVINNDGTGVLIFTAAAFNSAAVGVTVARNLTLGGTYTGAANEIQGAIGNNDTATGGVVSITKDGAGTWALSGVNTYTGATTISGGQLTIDDGSIATSSNIVNDAALEYKLNANARTYANVISGSGTLTKSGSNTFTLTNSSNSYAGATSVTGGILEVTANNALGTNAAGTSVTAGAALQLTGVTYSTAEALSLNGTGISNGGALVNSGTSSFAGQVTAVTNASINAGGGTLSFTGGLVKNGTVLTLTGGGTVNVDTVGISGSGANSDLIVSGVTLNANVANTYNGPTFIRSTGSAGTGIFNANIADALPTSIARSAVTMDDSGLGSSQLNLAGGANQAIASLTGAASSLVNLNANTLTLGTTSGSTTFAGVISGSGGSLVKDGASTQILSGASTYDGTTTISGGTLQLGAGSTTGSLSTSSAIVNNGNLTINRSNTVTQGTDFSGAAITGTGSFTQAGTGTTTLNVTNSHSGGTTVTAGTLTLSHNSAAGTAGITISGASAATLQIDAGITLAGNNITFSNTNPASKVVHDVAISNPYTTGTSGNLTSSFVGGQADTTAQILDGTRTLGSTLEMLFANTSAATNDGIRRSDVFTTNGTSTDTYVIQLSTGALAADSALAWLNGSNEWVHAGTTFYNETYSFAARVVGDYGYDSGNVWAVVNHGGSFTAVPEPTSALVGLLIGAGLLRRRRCYPVASVCDRR